MKFSRVEISAFRIYDRPEDATFDFTLPEGIADFVAIYAPNGFGKTSFYDAVEWGVTNNILRFWHDENLMEKSIEALKDINENQIRLWRNTSSSLETSVKIYTDTQAVFDRTLKVHGNRDADITGINDGERKDFRQVILSQEWISSFLKEIDGERRYEIFMENPDLKELNTYYTNLKCILDQANENVISLKALIIQKQHEIIGNSESNLLQSINDHIDSLSQNYNVSIDQLSISSTQEDIIDFKNSISAKSVELDKKIETNQEKLDLIGIARSGSGNIPSLQQYIESSKAINRLKEEIDSIITKIGHHDAVDQLLGKEDQLKASFRNKNGELDLLVSIASEFDSFIEIRSSIAELQTRISVVERESRELNTSYETLIEQSNSIRTKRDSGLRQIAEFESKLKAIPSLTLELEEIANKLVANKEIQSQLSTSLNKHRLDYATVENEISRFEQLISDLENASQQGLALQSVHVANEYRSLIDSKAAASEIIRLVNELEVKAEEQQNLNNVIQEFIKTGHDIVNKSRATSCPLCSHEYSNFNELASKIAGNKALQSTLQSLLLQKSALTESLAFENHNIENRLTFIRGHYQEIVDKLSQRLLASQESISKTEQFAELNGEAILLLETRIQEIHVEFNGFPSDIYEEELSTSLKNLTDQRDIYSANLFNLEKRISENAELSKINKDISDQLIRQLTVKRGEPRYINVSKWLRENRASLNASVEFVYEKLEAIKRELSGLSRSIEELEREIEDRRVTLATLTDDELRADLDKLQSNIAAQRSLSMNFEYFLLNKLGVKTDIENIEELLKKLEASLRSSIEINKKLQADYQTLERFSENIIPYLKSESLRLEIANLENELQFMSIKVVPPIDQERDNTKKFLERKVEDFFFTKLINKLYNKIDPHPEYKSVEFRVDLDADVPRLDIFVVNDHDERKLIPNLYFSTAQINILSMSIFLASALNSPTYKSIFIDDPIQSMDSINVLSTIDLIRSIVVNEQRQIILSTHDNNFYNLLKKKIPYPQYKSTFIELETFGKVKARE